MIKRAGAKQAAIGRRDFLRYSAAGLAGSAALGRAGSALAQSRPLEFYIWSAAVDLVKSHITGFEQKTGLKVNLSTAPWAQYRETLVTKFVGGAPLDALWVSDTWLPEWAEAGWLAPVGEFAQLTKYNADVEDFCVQSMTYNRQQYGITYYSDWMGFLYNEEILAKAGIAKPPETWDELTEQALKIKQAGLSQFPVLMSLAHETWLIEFMSAMVFSQGGRFTDDKGAAVMADPEKGAVKALSWVVDAVQKHKIVSPACVETGELAGLKAFGSGQFAFGLIPKFRVRTLNDPAQSQIPGKVKLMLMPRGAKGSHATVGWMRFYGLTAQARKDKARTAEAVQLMEWFGGKAENDYRFQKMLFIDVGAAFGVKSLFQDPDMRKAYQAFGDVDLIAKQQSLAMKKDVITPWFGEWNDVNGPAWQAAIVGKSTPQEALKRSADKWNELKKNA
ncbi:MAG: sugar ABC transporter substrate-binding protein [Proteobacteria bacterium]|nr:sugar ABC transporter substrate-binding protein [Pseudomonadota bacterium]